MSRLPCGATRGWRRAAVIAGQQAGTVQIGDDDGMPRARLSSSTPASEPAQVESTTARDIETAGARDQAVGDFGPRLKAPSAGGMTAGWAVVPTVC